MRVSYEHPGVAMSDIDPMTLSKHHDMQRYDLPGDGGQYDLELLPLDDGGYVIYEDALAAVQAARAEGHRDAIASMDGQSVILASECEKQIAAAEQRGYKRGEQDQIDMTRDWGLHQHEVGRLQGQRDERERCRAAVLDHFKVAPLAAEPILRRIG